MSASNTALNTASNTIRTSATIIGITLSSAWISSILYSYNMSKNYKKMNEFDTLFFSLEGLRNSFIIGGAVGFITSSALMT